MEPNINDPANAANMSQLAIRTATTPAAPTLTIDANAPVLCTLHPDGSITGTKPELCQASIDPVFYAQQQHMHGLVVGLVAGIFIGYLFAVIQYRWINRKGY